MGIKQWWAESNDDDDTNYWSRKNGVVRWLGRVKDGTKTVLAFAGIFGIPAIFGVGGGYALSEEAPTEDTRYVAVCEYQGGTVYDSDKGRLCINSDGDIIVIDEDKL